MESSKRKFDEKSSRGQQSSSRLTSNDFVQVSFDASLSFQLDSSE